MKPYYSDEWVTQYCSSAVDVLPGIESDSIDLLCTDPPYGIGFMGKDWDKALPDKTIWAECLRVLKPGAFAFVMSIPRSDCLSRMIISLEDAGFRTNFTPIYWAYASGFPKAQNIGKAVDKRGGVSVSWFGKWLKEWRLEKGITQKEIAKLFPSKTGGLTGCVANWELGYNIPTPGEFTTICRHFNLPFESIEEAEREVLGIERMRAKQNWCPTSQDNNTYITKPQTPQAKALDGSYGGFQPKPAVEVIIVCMKPLSEKTFVDQALKNGHGVTWLDDCRIPYESEGDKSTAEYNHKGNERFKGKKQIFGSDMSQNLTVNFQLSGRFPANLLVSDDVLNDGRITRSRASDYNWDESNNNNPTHIAHNIKSGIHYGDSGSFSRYFDLDKCQFFIVPKASKSEKNKGCEGLPDKELFTKGHGNQEEDDVTKRFRTMTKNNHPTVKPLKLMSYLITLGSRAGDVILDPFGGSGTTALASKLLGRKCITAEIDEKYCEIALKRCSQGVMELAI